MPGHSGHRQRVKTEFLARGVEGWSDHRILELLLFYAIPQGDVNELAHRLVDHFGSLAGVLDASAEELKKVPGVGEHTAVLLKLGIIAPGGRLLPPEEVAPELRRYVERDEDGNGRFHLTPQVYLTAGDVRNLQLAKAAVAAGIEVLSQRRGVLLENVEGLYLAGGFGTYIDPASAMAIGMLPKALAGKVRPLGNTALAGAAALALDSRLWPKVEDTARSCAYIELSGQPDFTRAFTGNMGF